ncbi:hypothetical protein VOLCADRAFT_121704 [Volvox carteri f. nagariensis]|uniref:Uncharacterized protein n=1 Tax=Volvox carteri f. nagariensis TaxID=3068 RepID=D8UI23_VOLCA|nr:uncharacterized protein VOLCADRAFT_121704 [Volvox carteri f. nagariensis]EFJ40622.1 hypothetical protein VOLCADRAFT_121704 [Volvox carteri f. nagariensis]|eukprot:XP_002958329.1 hypothetical protein VOLCADRAFT_121704 [Volvox carteri f. nagariensis]
MELSPEGLAAAAATRQAARKRQQDAKEDGAGDGPVSPQSEQPAKRLQAIGGRPPSTCTHEVAVPEGFDESTLKHDPEVHGTLHEPIYKGSRAKEYPFVLDPFQETSIACLERHESVLVSAHTSAGKTVVAEYAIAMGFRSNQRALSNQKFRELSEAFAGDVGLMTGDVSLNPNASCIVMTTEILRSMIYRGSELLREVAWVVFDEVHYMQDRERGVVWEETIIFLDHRTKMVFLSATLSNSSQFAAWVAHLHKSPCHVVYTDYRPTPLQHYAYPSGGRGLYLLLDERGNFRTENFDKLRESLSMTAIKFQNWEPVIFFSFARRDCESYANALLARKEVRGKGGDPDREREKELLFDFNTEDEKSQVEEIYDNALQCLSEADRQLKPISRMLPLLKRGIGVHHSGLLPILKELIEILFQEGLLKVLFTTETFAMGLNMPARCVVFTAMRKWDGAESRWISSGEYIQMSGRAGRRGMDDRGLVVMMLDAELEEQTCRAIMQGKPSPLLSSFKLTYYTMLNMLRRLEGSDTGTMEYVIRHSFQQFQQESQLPKLERELADLEAEMAALGREGEEAMAAYQRLRTEIAEAGTQLQALITKPAHCLTFLRAGRLVRVSSGGVDFGTGVVVSVLRRPDAPPATADGGEDDRDAYLVDCILSLDASSLPGQDGGGSGDSGGPQPAAPGAPGSVAEVVPVTLSCLAQLHSLRISLPPDLRPEEARRGVMVQVGELLRRHGEAGLPRLDPIEDMDIRDPGLSEVIARIEALEVQLQRNPVFKAEKDAAKFAPYLRRAALAARAETLRAEMRTSQLSAFKEEAACRTAVLRRLGHIDAEGVMTLKGRAACEIDTADELLASELLLNGTFSSLESAQLVALASCLIPMAGPLAQLQAAARHIAEVSRECKLDLDPDEYVESFKPALMDVIYSWSKGATFAQVCDMTDIFEGSLVRATRRLDELLGQLANAAAAVGDHTLADKIREATNTIRRDIMFAASLYI